MVLSVSPKDWIAINFISFIYPFIDFLKDKFNNANINVDPNQILDNGAVAVAVDPQQIKKEQTSLELKIQQVKMAIEAKQKKRKLPS